MPKLSDIGMTSPTFVTPYATRFQMTGRRQPKEELVVLSEVLPIEDRVFRYLIWMILAILGLLALTIVCLRA